MPNQQSGDTTRPEDIANTDDYDHLIDEKDTFGEEELMEEVDPEEEDVYPSVVISGMSNTLKDWKNHTDTSPELSADDIDAAWQGAANDGEETFGGDAPTPDMDRVEDLGEPWGIEYEPNEEIDIVRKLENLEEDRKENEEWGRTP